MSYQHEHIPLYEPEDGYNHIADVYHTYHYKLNQRDFSAIKKYLPRSLRGLSVLDLGGGDGRMAQSLHSYEYGSYTIVDIAASLLAKAPQRTIKVCADLRTSLPLPNTEYDLILCSFVLLHLEQIETLCQEARRCIKPEGRMLLIHHYERRPYLHTVNEQSLKIKTWHRRHEEVEEELRAAGWEVDIFPVDDLTNIYCCFPQ